MHLLARPRATITRLWAATGLRPSLLSAPTTPVGALPAGEPRRPLYVTGHGGKLRLSGERLIIEREATSLLAVPLDEIAEAVLIGSVDVTTPALHALLRAGATVSWHARDGWFLGHTVGFDGPGLERRLAQVRAASEPRRALSLASSLVAAKLDGQRLLMRRAGVGAADLKPMERLLRATAKCDDLAELRGIEGAAAAVYFGTMPWLLRARGRPFADAFPARRRRPATDPLNAALSFAYAMLCRWVAVALSKYGFDVRLGFLHAARAGRPALALDLMEPLRPLIADRAVLACINRGELDTDGFIADGEAVVLGGHARKALVAAFERRLDDEIGHPALARPLAWRAVPAVQAQLLGEWLTGARPDLPQPRPR